MLFDLLWVLCFSIGVSASSGYDRYEADAYITISQRLTRVEKTLLDISIGKSQSIFQAIKYIKEMICLIRLRLVHGKTMERPWKDCNRN